VLGAELVEIMVKISSKKEIKFVMNIKDIMMYVFTLFWSFIVFIKT
jgi:hypothetical protein